MIASSRPGTLPALPTAALPGTEAKILVMMDRAARREQLFHPLDGFLAEPPQQAGPLDVALDPVLSFDDFEIDAELLLESSAKLEASAPAEPNGRPLLQQV
jgi:hypothetical protein